MKPSLSVIIPTWNRANMVCQAIDSALIQSEKQIEVIVVDDGSTDGTSEMLSQRYKSRIKLLTLARRGGVGAARNAGVRAATGDLIGFLDSDDLWLPGKMAAEMSAFERFPQADSVVSDCWVYAEDLPNRHSWWADVGLLDATEGKVGWLDDVPWRWGHWANTLAMCSITIRRRALPRFGDKLFDEDLVAGEDWEFEMRVFHECRVLLLPAVWAHVRRFDDATRLARGIPGRPPTAEQECVRLQAHLEILERISQLNGLAAKNAEEIQNGLLFITQQLNRLKAS